MDVVVIPGGLVGAETLASDTRVIQLVQAQHARGGIVAAICAGMFTVTKVTWGRAIGADCSRDQGETRHVPPLRPRQTGRHCL
jgi:glutamine amidotransferase PdxT